MSRYIWSLKAPWFGGFSGLELSADGQSFVAVTDSSHLIKGQLERLDGQITSVAITNEGRLTEPDGAPIRASHEDSEGLALAQDGTLFVSFESVPRVTGYSKAALNSTSNTSAWPLPRIKAFKNLQGNKAFEAMAIGADGSIYVLPERAPIGQDTLPIWRWDGQDWLQFANFPQKKGFSPVGADFGPDGKLYILERQFLAFGFRSRLSRFEVNENGLGAQELLFESQLGKHDNLEGLAIWRDDLGVLRATMISDDNFFFLQHTEFVEYQLPD